MESDTQILANCPDYLSIGSMLKATPAMEGDKRFIYIEASNEKGDQQDEIVLQKALRDSADWFLQFGNLDIDHFTLIGKPNPKLGTPGIPGAELFEIGNPIEVRFGDKKTFVKGQIAAGNGPAAEKANEFWSSLTERNPPARWYPSIGGHVLESGTDIDPETKTKKTFVRKVRWSNIGFSKTPVNQHVPTVATVPFGVLAKSWGVFGLDIAKALEASYSTDMANLSGGGALGMQSLDKGIKNYFDFRDRLAAAMRNGEAGANPTTRTLVDFCKKIFGLSPGEAAEYVERFCRDLKSGLNKRRMSHE